MNNPRRLFRTFVGGAIVGSALGLLYAPEKGSQTQKKVMARLKDLKDLKDRVVSAAEEKLNELLKWKDKMMESGEADIEDIDSSSSRKGSQQSGRPGGRSHRSSSSSKRGPKRKS
jgi:gas vesicle protein